ncbi:glycosyltransferase [Frigoribacterium sp. PvP032]|uniref:glycosyltransferase family 2 protein n=1 Tax=Frigoribacterium sp. PvP032 TaxID=2806589 RepID=UPI001B595B46|nr:glycosyltransferase [Frigoribacterium sp. PvP032]MBP1191896.1 glycosyltransferase involved in cell wall biosynthesis [Frigoribacterium sp. PvP032]
MTTDPTAPRLLTIAVLTFRRPRDLDAVLPLLVEQARGVRALGVEARVLVVDNDASGTGRDRVEAAALAATAPGDDAGPVTVDYVVEATPGIASARNRALDECAGSDLLVFIDDDERPSEPWLAALLALQAETGAAAVVGPVRSEYEVEPEPFIVEGRFFVRRRLPTGTAVEVAATNNLLLDLAEVRRQGLSFDVALGQLGGEDTLFTRSLVAAGGTILWCAEAVVTDVVPAHRVTRRWVVRRAYSSGNGWGLTSVMLSAGGPARLATRLRLTARGAVRVAGGVARLVLGTVVRSLGQRARGVRTIARGAGMVAGAWGAGYREYGRVDG